MNISNFPDLVGFSQRSRTTSALKARLQTVSQEAVTGIKADLTKAAGGRVGDVHLLQKALADITVENRVHSLASSRIDLITQSITNSRAALDGIGTRATVALSTGNTSFMETISGEASSTLQSVMSSLSTQHGSRNLFSGNATDTATFANADTLLSDVQQILSTSATADDAELALDFYFNDPAGGFATNIYQGGTENAPGIRLGAKQSLDIDVRGDNAAIKDVLRGLSVMAASTKSGLDASSEKFSSIFGSGVSSTSNGDTGLITLEGNMGIFAANVDKLVTRNQAEEATLTTAYQSIASRDQFEAASELKQLEVALESSYIITSRLANLSLVNYLR